MTALLLTLVLLTAPDAGLPPPLDCACAPSDACFMKVTEFGTRTEKWVPAPKGLTLNPGEFMGACVPKECVETPDDKHPLGYSMPKECR